MITVDKLLAEWGVTVKGRNPGNINLECNVQCNHIPRFGVSTEQMEQDGDA